VEELEAKLSAAHRDAKDRARHAREQANALAEQQQRIHALERQVVMPLARSLSLAAPANARFPLFSHRSSPLLERQLLDAKAAVDGQVADAEQATQQAKADREVLVECLRQMAGQLAATRAHADGANSQLQVVMPLPVSLSSPTNALSSLPSPLSSPLSSRSCRGCGRRWRSGSTPR
tara:strand:- start:26 stop:556 length:531 start_codon:yes stop_codon:yes gene_type:complete